MNEHAHLEYRVSTETVGGRDNGTGRSRDGLLDVRLAKPGAARIGTNPEQLLGVAWSTSFASAIKQSAQSRHILLPSEIKIHAELELTSCDAGLVLRVQMNIHVPDFDLCAIAELIAAARMICPYCRATQGNVTVEIKAT